MKSTKYLLIGGGLASGQATKQLRDFAFALKKLL